MVVEKGVGQVTGRPATEGGIGDGEGSRLGFDHHSRCCLSSVSEETLNVKLLNCFYLPLDIGFRF